MNEATPEKIVIGAEVGKTVTCAMCQKEGTSDQFITLQGAKGETTYLCPECKEKTNEMFEAETKNPNMLLALLVGTAAAAVGGVIWYYIAVLTGREIGYVAIGLGYLVGFGVYFGSGKKRGQKLQILSALLTIAAIIIAEKFIFDFFLNDYLRSNLSEFPGYDQSKYISVSFFEPEFWKSLVSPIGLLIYAIGTYVAYTICKPRKI